MACLYGIDEQLESHLGKEGWGGAPHAPKSILNPRIDLLSAGHGGGVKNPKS